MDKLNHLDELPIAELDPAQLSLLQKTEESLNQGEDQEIYVIALKKSK